MTFLTETTSDEDFLLCVVPERIKAPVLLMPVFFFSFWWRKGAVQRDFSTSRTAVFFFFFVSVFLLHRATLQRFSVDFITSEQLQHCCSGFCVFAYWQTFLLFRGVVSVLGNPSPPPCRSSSLAVCGYWSSFLVSWETLTTTDQQPTLQDIWHKKKKKKSKTNRLPLTDCYDSRWLAMF